MLRFKLCRPQCWTVFTALASEERGNVIVDARPPLPSRHDHADTGRIQLERTLYYLQDIYSWRQATSAVTVNRTEPKTEVFTKNRTEPKPRFLHSKFWRFLSTSTVCFSATFQLYIATLASVLLVLRPPSTPHLNPWPSPSLGAHVVNGMYSFILLLM